MHRTDYGASPVSAPGLPDQTLHRGFRKQRSACRDCIFCFLAGSGNRLFLMCAKITKKRLFAALVACYALPTREEITGTGDSCSGFPASDFLIFTGPVRLKNSCDFFAAGHRTSATRPIKRIVPEPRHGNRVDRTGTGVFSALKPCNRIFTSFPLRVEIDPSNEFLGGLVGQGLEGVSR